MIGIAQDLEGFDRIKVSAVMRGRPPFTRESMGREYQREKKRKNIERYLIKVTPVSQRLIALLADRVQIRNNQTNLALLSRPLRRRDSDRTENNLI